MRQLPLDHPGTADHRSPGRFLWWMAKGQWHTLLLGMFSAKVRHAIAEKGGELLAA